MSDPAIQTGTPGDAEITAGNTVAVIGLILTLTAGLMCGVLFAAASRLPARPPDSEPTDRGSEPVTDIDGAETPDEPGSADPAGGDPSPESTETDKDPPGGGDRIGPERAALELQVLLLASATAVLNLVGLVLSVAGLFIPNRPRGVAVCGTILALCLCAGVFGVMAVGALLDPAGALPGP